MKTSRARYREKYKRLNTLDTFQLIRLYKIIVKLSIFLIAKKKSKILNTKPVL